MEIWCYILVCGLVAIVVTYGLLEVHYFLRMALCLLLAKFCKKKVHILDTTEVTGLCLTTDIDTFFTHMNNARYLRELDFARVDFYERTKLYKTIVTKGGGVVQGAATIRYRRFIKPFSIYRISSKIIYWDSQSIFMEHRFISPKDKFIYCIVICRQRVLDCSAEDVMTTLLNSILINGTTQIPQNDLSRMENGGGGGGDAIKLKPEMPLEISKWNEFNEISSKNLRGG